VATSSNQRVCDRSRSRLVRKIVYEVSFVLFYSYCFLPFQKYAETMHSIHVCLCNNDLSCLQIVVFCCLQKVMPAFTDMHTEFSEQCLFSPVRDRYRTQEIHKSIEEGTKWFCHFCGKAFINENYLDMHFDNRHTDQLEV
jgi:hypothetical protein